MDDLAHGARGRPKRDGSRSRGGTPQNPQARESHLAGRALPRTATAGRILAIVNPVAGTCDPDAVHRHLSRATSRAGRDLDLQQTPPDRPVVEWVRELLRERPERLVVAGGDGTIRAAATACVETGVPIAIVPSGTANVLARDLELSFDVESACVRAVESEATRSIDALRIGTGLYFCHVSVGVFSEIAAETSADAKQTFHRWAYLWNGLRKALSRRSWRFRITVDGEAHAARASSVLVANAASTGAGDLAWKTSVAPDDGRAHVCVLKARSPREYLSLAWDILRRRPERARTMEFFEASRWVEVHARRGHPPVRGDGESLGHEPLSLTVVPAALRVVV